MKQRACNFETINKINKPLARLSKKITNVSNKTRDITKVPTDIKRITKKYYEQLYIHTFDNLDRIDQLLEKHKQPLLTQNEVEFHLNSPVTTKKIEFMILKLLKNKSLGPGVFTGELHQV